MAIKPVCDAWCKKELKGFGALMFGPPKGNKVRKYHICRKCFKRLKKLLRQRLK